MACTSASSIRKSFKYDVFLSFRGEDTRKNFVDHLYHALHRRGITTYKDDERIEKGENISDQLDRSIEESRFYIIVFSKNYASSAWCLEELVKIMECQKMIEHTAYPVFYDVEPTEVRNQSGEVGEAFAKHVEKEAVGRWRDALKETANLAGWELKKTLDGHQAKFIQKIVMDISLKLRFINWRTDENLVGIQTRVNHIVSSLKIGSEYNCMIGIKGIGGGGKTTLARAVFDYISIWFEGKSFVENIREVSKGSMYGLKELQKQVLQDVFTDQTIEVKNLSDGKNMMKNMMPRRKVVVVLDDVDDIDQLEALAGEPTWFRPGSKIIVTTRDEQVLVAYGVHDDAIHNVNLLSHEEAISLFSRYAFKRDVPIQGYEELSGKVVHYAAGLPLTIKVLGSFLCRKTEREWIDAIERLKKIPEDQTLKRLELSFNSLENDHKEIFLDVACILKGMKKEKAITILESCGYHAEIGLRVLEQKSLITISEYGVLWLHDPIEEMGKNIIRRLHPDEPKQHNRLWLKKEIEDILKNDMGTDATRSMKLVNTKLRPTVIMKGLRKMKELRFLYVNNELIHKCKNNEVGQYLPNALRSLHWHRYPFGCLPKTFQANMLRNLEMEWSNIIELWEGGERKGLNKLRFLNLSNSKLKSFNLGITPNLETLDLKYCKDFVELYMPIKSLNLNSLSLGGTKVTNLDLGMTPNLKTIDLERCEFFVELYMPIKSLNLNSLNLSGTKVTNLDLGMTPNLEKLNLEGCIDFLEFHMLVKCPKLKFLKLGGLKLCNFNLGLTPSLEILDLSACKDFVELHTPIEFPQLKYLNLSGSKLSKLNLKMTPSIENLNLIECKDLVELYMPIEFPQLKFLYLRGSKVRNLNLGLTPHLEILDVTGCNDFVELQMPTECPMLNCLYLGETKVTNLNLAMTSNLSKLYLGGCNDFVELHMTVECSKLEFLDLSNSKVRSLNLEMTPKLETLDLGGCNDLVELHLPIEFPHLKFLYLNGSKLSNLNLGMTPNLEMLNLGGCNEFVELHMPIECPRLEYLNLSGSKLSSLNLGMTMNICTLDLKECYHLQEIHAPMGCLKNLVYLNLSGCSRFQCFVVSKQHKLPALDCFTSLKLITESIDTCPVHLNNNLPKFQLKCFYDEPLKSSSGNIEKLISFGLCACTNLESLSTTICGLQHLGELTLVGNIPELPKDLYQLESLEELTLSVKEIKHLPDSICMLKHLKYLNLKSCWLLEQLPKNLGKLECLEELDLTDCISLRDIPNSMCNMKYLRRLLLSYCIILEKLPEELGLLECLIVLNIEGAGISRLPLSTYQLKGLLIIGSRWRLESYGFTSLKEISRYTASCYAALCKT